MTSNDTAFPTTMTKEEARTKADKLMAKANSKYSRYSNAAQISFISEALAYLQLATLIELETLSMQLANYIENLNAIRMQTK